MMSSNKGAIGIVLLIRIILDDLYITKLGFGAILGYLLNIYRCVFPRSLF